jgi:small subunit ribosomal protein S6
VRRYETIFILRPDLGEAQLQEAVKRFEGIVAGGGELIETDEWGFRDLAYRIKGERRGYYVRLDYAAEAATMNEVERNLKLHDAVLRFLSVLVEKEADVGKAREDVEARKRRIAEARAAAEARAQQRAAAAAEAEQQRAHEEQAHEHEAAPVEQATAGESPEQAAQPSEPESGGKQD